MAQVNQQIGEASVLTPREPAWRGPIIAALVLTGLVVWVFSDFIFWQVEKALTLQADWGHTLVIPLIAGYFIYMGREQLLARPFRTTWIGLVPVLAGVGWFTMCTLIDALRHRNLQASGLVLTLAGLALLFCGFRAMRYLWFPLLYLFVFGQTISERLMQVFTFPLQDFAALGSHMVLVVMGLDVERSGNVLTMINSAGEAQTLNIAEACSGMRMVMAFLALSVAMAYTGLRRNWQRALLVLLAVPVALFVNVLRVVTLALLARVDSGLAAGDFHSFVGLLWLVPAFLIYLGLIWVIRHLVVEEAKR